MGCLIISQYVNAQVTMQEEQIDSTILTGTIQTACKNVFLIDSENRECFD